MNTIRLPVRMAILLSALGLWLAPVGAQARPDDTSGSLTLPQALQQSLLHNPALKRYPYDLRVTDALSLQAGIRPTPQLGVKVEDLLGSGDLSGSQAMVTTLSLSQLVELGDKRQRRLDLALSQGGQQQLAFEQQKLEVLADTTRLFYQQLRLQALLDWSTQRIQREQHALDTIRQRADAGAVMQADVAKMALRLSRSQTLNHKLEGELRQARRRLASQWAAEPGFDQVTGALRLPATLPDSTHILDALATAPAYLEQQGLTRVLQAKARLEEAKNQYDLTLEAGVKHNAALEDAALTLSVSLPLTLTPPNQGGLLAAKEQAQWQLDRQALLLTQLRLTLEEMLQGLTNNAEQAHRLKHQLLPQAQTLLDQSLTAYNAGRISVLQLADAQEELFAVERDLIEARYAALTQLLEMERLTGRPMTPAHPSLLTQEIQP
ncbi:TolC family protein [Ferrimonas sp.]|uniref:TolC family protein n=1 Tax=Ferrimonas sp. TaxID=2080861 RepID=UPI003A9473CD